MSNEKKPKEMTKFNLANSVKNLVKAGLLVNKKKAIERSIDSAVDTLEDKLFEINKGIEESRNSLYKTDRGSDKSEYLKTIVDLHFEKKECEFALEILKEEKGEMDKKVPVVSANEDEENLDS